MLILTLFSPYYIFAQLGISTASLTMGQSLMINSPDQVKIEEYINYHEHHIPLPKADEEVALSIDQRSINSNNILLQVGISTKQLLDYNSIPPVNISLVIDRSGSMFHNNKLEHVKIGLSKFIKGLRPLDFISIVAYDSEASIILESIQVKEIESLDVIIDHIQAGGSTNLYGGIDKGYKEVLKHLNPSFTNKVILLTDGIANHGITETEEIVEHSYFYNKKGIEISTIGLGDDVNHKLLSQMAMKGNGSNHFIGNSKAHIEKVFEDELESLLSSIGKHVYLEIEYPHNIKVKQVYGYNPMFKQGRIRIPLENLNNGLTQVVLLEFTNIDQCDILPIKAILKYEQSNDVTQERLELFTKINIDKLHRFKGGDMMKNYFLAKMALALKEMIIFVNFGNKEKGIEVLDETLVIIQEQFPHLKDEDLKRVKNILIKQKALLMA